MWLSLAGLFVSLVFWVGPNDASGTGLTLNIEAHAEHCFYDDVASVGDRVFFSFQVTAGGSLDIDVYIQGPELLDVWTLERESEGRVLFKAPTVGQYKFCLRCVALCGYGSASVCVFANGCRRGFLKPQLVARSRMHCVPMQALRTRLCCLFIEFVRHHRPKAAEIAPVAFRP